jgi:hypothetical protein
MRFPVFSRRSNPSIDPPILRKSRSYVDEQVAAGRAVWVDPADPRKGIICRDLLHLAPRELAAEMPIAKRDGGLGTGEIPGLKFIPPASASRQRRAFGRFFGGILKPVTPVGICEPMAAPGA